MGRRVISIFLILLLGGCSTFNEIDPSKNKCILSIQKVHSSERVEGRAKHGVYVYRHIESFSDSVSQEFFLVVIYENGKRRNSFGGGSSITHRLRSAIIEANLPNTDYPKLFENTARIAQQETGVTRQILDGAEYRLEIEYEGTRFGFSEYELISRLNYLADYDPILARLKSVIDTLTKEVGRSVIEN